jgi:hypothetical protein
MRSPARLFAAALIAAMTAIAVVALVADLVRAHPHRPQAAGVAAGFAQRSIPGLAALSSDRTARRSSASDAVSADPADAAESPAAGAYDPAASAYDPASAAAEQAGSSAAATAPATGTTTAPATKPGTVPPPATHAAAVPAVKRPAKAKRTHPTRRQLRAAAVRRGKRPGEVTRSHYLRHLTGGPADEAMMWALGRRDARQNTGRQQHVVLLDIGGQLRHGVLLSTTPHFVSYGGLARAVIAYVRGYHSAQRRGAPVTVAIGTNNDLETTAHSGRVWARQVVQPVHRVARHYRGVAVAGASDIEPGFRVGPRGTEAWVRGFLHATRAPLIFNGSADGCSPVFPFSRCAHGWTANDLAWVAGAASPRRISALPQVYNYTMADQWAMISLTAVRNGHRALRFHGPLTENAACRGEKNCPTMGSLQAWQALRNSLSLLGPVSLPARTDLDVH